jgi:GxxExxY protein
MRPQNRRGTLTKTTEKETTKDTEHTENGAQGKPENALSTLKRATSQLVFEQESYRILGACFEVYKDKGCGFLEGVYQDCLSIEFRLQDIPHTVQPPLRLTYKGEVVPHVYVPDFVCFEKVVVELKATAKIADDHRAQLHNYLKASGMKLGLLINFGHYPGLEYERIVR